MKSINLNSNALSSLFDLVAFFECSTREVQFYNYKSKLIENISLKENGWTTITTYNPISSNLQMKKVLNRYPFGSIDSTYFFDSKGMCRKLVISQPEKLETIIYLNPN
jgi:hypothetical protein